MVASFRTRLTKQRPAIDHTQLKRFTFCSPSRPGQGHLLAAPLLPRGITNLPPTSGAAWHGRYLVLSPRHRLRRTGP